MTKLLTCFHAKYPASLVYMLQASEYDTHEYLDWFWRVQDFRKVQNRGRLDLTLKARLLLGIVDGAVIIEMLAVLGALTLGISRPLWLLAAAAIVILSPLLLAYLLAVVVWLGHVTIQAGRQRSVIENARASLAMHPGQRIAIAGSYGKTTMKEILLTLLSEAKRVAATPGNMNTPIGISRFIAGLKGDEEVLIFELGEYYPGDIAELCDLVKPQLGVITGINEAHLSKFKTLDRTTAAIFELSDFLGELPVYKNGDNALVRSKVSPDDPLAYTASGVNGWVVSEITIAVDSTSVTVHKSGMKIVAKSQLLGRQNVGPLVAAIDVAHSLGLTLDQITAGVAKTKPYEHRMQPRQLVGAWVIDDTYNGNSDGVRAGLAWLASVEAKRRVYVTPGLVEQGSQTAAVHRQIGRDIAGVADLVVLIQNSVTPHIQQGLKEANFVGELVLIDDPLNFYSNIEHFIAAGDVVLMQNDWTDNYA